MAYAYLAADMSSGELVPPELPLTSVRWGRQLNGWGQLTGRLPLPPPVNADNRRLVEAYRDATDRKRRVIYVLRDGTPMGAWWITSRRYDLAQQAIEIRADELPAYWSWRLFGWTAPSHLVLRKYGPGTPVQVAHDIIAAIAPSMGLDMSAVVPPDTGATVSYEGRLADGKSLGDIIADLAKPEGDLGFDYRIDLAGEGTSFQRRLIMAPQVGADIGLIAKLTRPHGLGNVVAGEVIEDERRANYIAALGQGDGFLPLAFLFKQPQSDDGEPLVFNALGCIRGENMPRSLVVALAFVGVGEAGHRFDVAGLEFEGLVEFGDGLFKAAFGRPEASHVVMKHRFPGSAVQTPLQVTFGRPELALGKGDHCEKPQGLHVITISNADGSAAPSSPASASSAASASRS